MTADIDEIRKALSLLFSGGAANDPVNGAVVELRALGDGGVHSGYFTDFGTLADRAKGLDSFKE
ncbi:MAG: hypothetical protein WC346_14065, partial [Methanogenium sp.]